MADIRDGKNLFTDFKIKVLSSNDEEQYKKSRLFLEADEVYIGGELYE